MLHAQHPSALSLSLPSLLQSPLHHHHPLPSPTPPSSVAGHGVGDPVEESVHPGVDAREEGVAAAGAVGDDTDGVPALPVRPLPALHQRAAAVPLPVHEGGGAEKCAGIGGYSRKLCET